MKLPTIRSLPPSLPPPYSHSSLSSDYSSAATAKFSLVRSVLCCHLLSSCDKLTKLFLAYDTLGVSITSRVGQPSLPPSPLLSSLLLSPSVGLLASCDSCWRTVALTRASSEFNPVIQELLWLAKKQYPPAQTPTPSPSATAPPSLLTLCCDVHGRGLFYLSDLCCVRCEKEIYSKLQT
jgi:hypothetical protein